MNILNMKNFLHKITKCPITFYSILKYLRIKCWLCCFCFFWFICIGSFWLIPPSLPHAVKTAIINTVIIKFFLFFNPFPSILSYFILLYRIYAYMSIFYRIYLLLQIIIKSYTIPLIENHANLLFLQIKSKRSHIWNHLKAKSVSLLILILLKRSNSLRKTMTVLSHSISISSWKNIWIKKKHRIQSYASLLCPLILFLWYAAGIHFFNQYWT